jgi:uncharacterized protein YgbK (DUF1537 family)
VNTLSRHLEPAAAAAITGQVAGLCSATCAHLVLKKIDSRTRGNVAVEAESIARVLGARRLIVAPAVPGIPWMRLPDGTTLLTKSGGFGHARTPLELLHPHGGAAAE